MTVFEDFEMIFDFEIVSNDDGKGDKYEILEVMELIKNGYCSFRKDGDELSLIDTTRGNVRIGILKNLRFK